MARAKSGNQRGTPTGPFGKRTDRVLKTAGRPTPRTGGGMKLPTKKVRPPKPTDTGGRVMPKKYKPRLQVDPKKPKKIRKVPGSRGGPSTGTGGKRMPPSPFRTTKRLGRKIGGRGPRMIATARNRSRRRSR